MLYHMHIYGMVGYAMPMPCYAMLVTFLFCAAHGTIEVDGRNRASQLVYVVTLNTLR